MIWQTLSAKRPPKLPAHALLEGLRPKTARIFGCLSLMGLPLVVLEYWRVLQYWRSFRRPTRCGSELDYMIPLFEHDNFPSDAVRTAWIESEKKSLLCNIAPHRCSNAAAQGARLVYIDVGARTYNSSLGWFARNYPVPDQSLKFVAYAFELDPAHVPSYATKDWLHTDGSLGNVVLIQAAAGTEDGEAWVEHIGKMARLREGKPKPVEMKETNEIDNKNDKKTKTIQCNYEQWIFHAGCMQLLSRKI